MSVSTTLSKATDSEIVQILKKLRKEIRKTERFSESSMDQFKQIALILGNNSPKLSDSTLLEIDDILYQDDIESDESRNDSSEPKMALSHECKRLYVETYCYFATCIQVLSRTLETTYLQLLEHSPDEFYNDTKYVLNLLRCAFALMNSIRADKICLSLKILKIALNKNKNVLVIFEVFSSKICFLWMLKLPNIPEGRLLKQKRISTWLKHQSTIVIKTIDFKSLEFIDSIQTFFDIFTCIQDDNYVIVEQEFDSKFIKNLHESIDLVPFAIDLIHSFFMSAKNEEEKIKRLKDFLLGISLYDLTEIKVSESGEYLVRQHNSYEKLLISEVVDRCITIGFTKELEILMKKRSYSDEVLKNMEKIYGCEVKPYLSGDMTKAYDIIVEESKLDQKEEETSNSIQNSEDEHDYTIEKFLFYDDFVKKLQVLNIMHTACMMCQELLKTEGDIIGLDSAILRNNGPCLVEYLNEALLDPSKRGHIPWIIKILLRKCPSIILPKRHEYLVDDLIKMLNGEEIDEYVEEELYFLINNEETIDLEEEEYEDSDEE